jgi:SPP1 family predicted phage head-tail adaptor
MRAGRLDRLVTLGKRTVASLDSYGEEQVTWADVQVWAERRELRGDEKWGAQQVIGTAACTYRIYYRTDLDVEDRLVDDSVTYDIHAISEIGRREGLELTCSARGEA